MPDPDVYVEPVPRWGTAAAIDTSRAGSEGAVAPPPALDVLEAMRQHPAFRSKTGWA
ncbi:MAG: hypothetical protein NZ654_07340 [Acidimicrobiales bacterium]|nr:hypothetical protein [Acidimicrobiales bacterium]